MREKNAGKYIAAAVIMAVNPFCTACGSDKPVLPTYSEQSLMISGNWLPDEMNVAQLELYKAAGLNTVWFGNHSGQWRSDEQYYLGSELTERVLGYCREAGLKAVLQYGDWIAVACDPDYRTQKPFSAYDIYDDYKDIIVGVSIVDEPQKHHMEQYGNDLLTEDYKSVYSVPYMCNLFPTYQPMNAIGYSSYDEYLRDYAEKIMSDFEENRFISVDYYPFGKTNERYSEWLRCYEKVAVVAKEYDAKMYCYIQTAEGAEFQKSLREEDIRLQINTALCFGVSGYSYYCYAVPKTGGEYLYDKCLLNQDGSPSELYEYAQKINGEVGSMSSAFLAYRWDRTEGFTDYSDGNGCTAIGLLAGTGGFGDRKYVSAVESGGDLLVGCFSDEDGGEGYMLVNFSLQEKERREVTVSLKNASYIAVYGGISKENGALVKCKEGQCTVALEPGEGKFIVPLV